MSYLLQQLKSVADPFLLGLSAPGMGAYLPVSCGRLFPWITGGALLLRRTMYPTLSAWQFCGFAGPGDATIRHAAGFGHAAGQAYQYACVRVLASGFISKMCAPVRLDFDDAGDLITPALPASPRAVTAVPIDGGRYVVSWSYDPLGQGGYPYDFAVFEGADAGSVDYDTPLVDDVTGLTYVPFVGNRATYSFTTPAFTHGTEHVFVVRGRNNAAVPERNTIPSAGRKALATAPAAAAQPRDAVVRPVSRRPR